MAKIPLTYKVKSFLVEARYKPRFKINTAVWELLDEYPAGAIGFLTSGGAEGRDDKKFSQYQVEFNRASFLAENIDSVDALNIWISKAANLINTVINRCEITTIERLGIRFHLYVNIDGIDDQAAYAKLIGGGLDFIKSDELKSPLQTGGFVLRFQQNPWDIRFGGFSTDHGVVKKYHKYNPPDSLFSKAGILYDTDCFQPQIDCTPAKQLNKKFDVTSYINGAHRIAAELTQKHIASINARTS